MADDIKKDANAAKGTENASEASAKVAKAAKKNPTNPKKTGPSAGTKLKKYFKDVKGETKKIVWPDAKTVFKSTGVVLLVVIICALIIWGIDTGLSAGVSGLKSLGQKDEAVTEVVTDENGETVTDENGEAVTQEVTEAETEEEAEGEEDKADENKDDAESTTEAETTEAEATEADATEAETTEAAAADSKD